MSGIAAIIHFDGKPVAPEDIAAMTSSMSHRGPDGISLIRIGCVALGHCMLRTTQESMEEVQPLASARGDLWLVVDGWLSNWEELRAEVIRRGSMLRDHSDAELILAAYEIWGEACTKHLEGDFAFLIWDSRRLTAFCARDRMGNKPLVYYWTGRSLVVASEISAVLALPWVRCALNEGMLVEHLAGTWISRDETLWVDLLRLLPAHSLIASNGGLRTSPYWCPNVEAVITFRSDGDYFDHYRELFLDSVRRSSRSHRPVAYEVSGGLDSSAIFCAARQMLGQGRLPAPGADGYTLDFSGDSRADEVGYARAVGKFLGVSITEVAPTIMPPSWYIADATTSCDQASFPNGAMAHDIKRIARQKGSRVIINGCGGDEWLGGSRAYYAEEWQAWRLRNMASAFVTDARTIGLPSTLHALARHGVFPLLPVPVQSALRAILQRANPLRDPPKTWLSARARAIVEERRSGSAAVLPNPARHGQRDLLAMLYEPSRQWGREQDDRLNAALGLETRRPLDTVPMMEFALATPERMRLRGDQNKYMHVGALRTVLPSEVLDRKTKAEFSSVIRCGLDQLENWFVHEAPDKWDKWLDRRGVRDLFRFYKDNPRQGWPIWVLWSIYGTLEPLPRQCPTRYTDKVQQNDSAIDRELERQGAEQ